MSFLHVSCEAEIHTIPKTGGNMIFFFLVTLFRVGIFIWKLPYGS